MGRGRDERVGVFSRKMGWGPATHRINEDVQLDEKKPNAATAKPVRIQARKVRSFAAWFV